MLEFLVDGIKDFELKPFGWRIFKLSIVLLGADLLLWIFVNTLLFDVRKIFIFGFFGIITGLVGLVLD